MSTDSGEDDLPKLLARAFLRAWEQYCVADLAGKHCEEVAQPFLKGLLVEFAKEGVTDEEQLVAAGLQHLISITRKPAKRSMKDEEKTTDGRWPVHFCINRAPAKFLLQWRASKTRIQEATGPLASPIFFAHPAAGPHVTRPRSPA